jgi:hypothetical protein
MEVRGQLHFPVVLTQERTAIPIEQEFGWIREAIWIFLRRETNLALARIEP